MKDGFYIQHARCSPRYQWARATDFHTLDLAVAVAEMKRRKAGDPESDYQVIEVRVVAQT